VSDSAIAVGLIGVNGQVAMSTTVGAFAVTAGITAPHGMVTCDPIFEPLRLTELARMTFFGWDLRAEPHRARVEASSLSAHAADLRDQLDRVEVFDAPRLGVSARILQLAGPPKDGQPTTRRAAAEQILRDISEVRARHRVDGVVVVNLASTEPVSPASACHEALDLFERALDDDDPAITPAMLYAYAALRAGACYVNFTPSVAAEIPALRQLAARTATVTAGKDAKTGQTLLKSVLAPMFRLRRLRVEGWYSTNILGNEDGFVLADDLHRDGKLQTKRELLGQLLGYDDVDHQVHIHYFRPSGDAKEAWDNVVFRGWLDTPMSLSLHWRGVDSALAAPLVLDLARLTRFAHAAGEVGVATHLAPFFKAPIDTHEQGFVEQARTLAAYCANHAERLACRSVARVRST
jgi:myo-inositol-1-phosphate synthase